MASAEAESLRSGHAAAVAALRVAYTNGGSGFGPDHVCEGSGTSAGAMGYGEITYDGMEPLYSALRLQQGDVVYDLGSGLGKLVLYLALRGDATRCVGIEVGERRHSLAEQAAARLKEDLAKGELALKPSAFDLVLGDIRHNLYRDATIVIFSNLCMDMSLNAHALRNFCKCPDLKTIISVAPMMPHQRLKLTGMVRVSCTWAKISSWHIYELLPDTRLARTMQAGGFGGAVGRSQSQPGEREASSQPASESATSARRKESEPATRLARLAAARSDLSPQRARGPIASPSERAVGREATLRLSTTPIRAARPEKSPLPAARKLAKKAVLRAKTLQFDIPQ